MFTKKALIGKYIMYVKICLLSVRGGGIHRFVSSNIIFSTNAAYLFPGGIAFFNFIEQS